MCRVHVHVVMFVVPWYTVQLSVRSVSKYKMYRIRPLTGCSAPEIDTNYHGTMVGCSLFNYCSCMMYEEINQVSYQEEIMMAKPMDESLTSLSRAHRLPELSTGQQ